MRRIQGRGFKEYIKFFNTRLGVEMKHYEGDIKCFLKRCTIEGTYLSIDLEKQTNRTVYPIQQTKNLLLLQKSTNLQAIDNILSFSNFIDKQERDLLLETPSRIRFDGVRIEELQVEVIKSTGQSPINLHFQFHDDTGIVRLSDIRYNINIV